MAIFSERMLLLIVRCLVAAIVEYAESEGINLIVIGTKETSNIKNMLLGSIASRMSRML